MDAAEVATVGEAQNAAAEFESYVNVDIAWRAIRFCLEVTRGAKPEELAVETEMQGEEAAIKFEEEVFALARYGTNRLVFCSANEVIGFLSFCGNWVQDINAPNLFAVNQRT